MVKRYPHTAIVTIEANGHLVNGEWVPGKPVEISVPGRYDPVSDGRTKLAEVVYSTQGADAGAQAAAAESTPADDTIEADYEVVDENDGKEGK